MLLTRSILLTAVLSLLVAPYSQAAPITVPTNLNPGDQYRLAFITSGTRDATSSDIDDYNDFVQAAADAVPQLAALGTTWKAIGSTATVDARDNTGTNPSSTGLPIFLLNDTKLADNNADLWDGSIDEALNVLEFGTPSPAALVWTGTAFTGVASSVVGALGETSAGAGDNSATISQWVDIPFDLIFTNASLPLYAIGGVLTVPEVPEPSTLLLTSIAGLICCCRRRC